MKGPADSEEKVYCHAIEKSPSFRVVECSSYKDISIPDLWTMKETAWILETKSAGRSIGFLPAKEYIKKHNIHEVDIPGF